MDKANCNQFFSRNAAVCVTCQDYAGCAKEYNNFTERYSLEPLTNSINNKAEIRVNMTTGVRAGKTLYNEISTEMSFVKRIMSIKNVIFNNPATIVFWEDGTKTVVKTQDGEKFDPEKGITMAFFKKMHGNKGSYFNEIKKWVEKYESPKYEKRLCVDDIIFSTRDEAEKVLSVLETVIDRYSFATVADLYDLIGLRAEYTDTKRGWLELRNARTARVRDGYTLILPKTVVIV